MSSPEELLLRAEKKGVASSGLRRFLAGGSDASRFEEAAELCVQAANLYKLRRELSAAGDCFARAAQFQVQAGNEDDAGNVFVDAFKSYKAAGASQQAVTALHSAVDLFTKRGQFRRSANFKMELAHIYEDDLADYPHAVAEYETAAEWYSQDQAAALANKAFLKCADLLALQGQYLQAADHYSTLIANSVGNKLSQWSLKDYYLKKALCQLAAADAVAATRTLHEGQSEDPNFADSRECKLLADLLDAYKDNDSEALSALAFEFDKFSKLDKWKTSILLKIKDTISAAEDDLL